MEESQQVASVQISWNKREEGKERKEEGTIKPSVFMTALGIINTPCYATISTIRSAET